MRFYFTQSCVHRYGISAMFRSIRTRTSARQMMHIKRSETGPPSQTGNNALMSRRWSDYGDLRWTSSFHKELVSQPSQGKIFIIFLVPSEPNQKRTASYAASCTYVFRAFRIAGSYFHVPNHRYQNSCNTVHVEYRLICTSPSLETRFWRADYKHFPWPRYYFGLFRVKQPNGCSIFEFPVLGCGCAIKETVGIITPKNEGYSYFLSFFVKMQRVAYSIIMRL